MRIAGAGCCLMDILYPEVDFSSTAFSAARSRRDGDGGLSPGRLVFTEDAERFTGQPFRETLAAIAGKETAAENVGGPSVASLIHAAQMLEGEGISVAYHGAAGEDEIGRSLREKLARTPLDVTRLESRPGRTSSTIVLSDPTWDSGRGERCFVNDIGAAWGYLPSDLGEDFFGADIIALGGTALVPGIHEGLPAILAEARSRGALTVVNTVFDFLAERRDCSSAWPLGGASAGPGPVQSYQACDLLIMDKDEALRLSGESDLTAALGFFEQSGVGAFVVTRGGESVLARAVGGRFSAAARREFPVSDHFSHGAAAGEIAGEGRIGREKFLDGPRGDTTGCGDAFAGGVIAALALQLKARPSYRRLAAPGLDLDDAVSWGIAAGAFTLSILGGTYYESRLGEKREFVSSYREDWLSQVRAPHPEARSPA